MAIEALRQGDRKVALAILMKTYGEAVYHYCLRMLQSRTLADDVHQTIFLEAYRDFASFSGSSLRPWLYSIAHNRCLDAAKVTRRWFTRFSLREDAPEDPDPRPSSEEQLIAIEASNELEACLGKLKPHIRVAVVLRYHEGFSYEEMGTICRESPTALKVRVARAMPLLRRCLQAKGMLG